MTAHPINSPYTPIRSAFTVIEKPLRFFYDQYPTPYYEEDLECFKNRFYLGGMVAYHIVVCAAPVTMVADMVIGIAECIFRTLSGDSLRYVAELARKKIIISPLHHLTFIITSLTPSAFVFGYILHLTTSITLENPKWGITKSALLFATGLAALWISNPLLLGGKLDNKVFREIPAPLQPFNQNRLLYMAVQTFFLALASRNFVFLELHKDPQPIRLITITIGIAISSLVWTFSYTLSQRMIGSFSPSWNHEAFSIFINRGARLRNRVGTGFNVDSTNRKPGMTFQDIGFTDSDLTYWKDVNTRYWTEQPCPPRPPAHP